MTFTEKLREASEQHRIKANEYRPIEDVHYAHLDFKLGFIEGFQLAIDQLNSLEATEDLVGVIKSPSEAAKWLEQWRER